MTLTEEQVKDLAKQEVDKWILGARDQAKLLKMHYYGTGLTEYLTIVQGLENNTQVALRKKYAISNQSIISSLMQPTNNAWSAKGGIITVDASESVETEIQEATEKIDGTRPLKKYLKDIWFDRFLTDPNGLLFIENDEERAYPVYKSIFDIKNMKVNGNTPEYVVYEPHFKQEEILEERIKPYDVLWIVDDAFYYKVKNDTDGTTILETIPNLYGIVPAIQNSNIVDTEFRIKVSPIHKQIALLKDYLIDNSINNIYKKLHGFPVFWFYTGKCSTCKGEGQIDYIEEDREVTQIACTSCNGSGDSMKRDVSDGIPLRTPKDSDSPTIAPNIAGYIQPDLETWREQRTELEHLFNLIYFSQWGTTIEKTDNETATGRFIDSQPVINKLHDYSDTFEMVHQRVLNLLAKFYAPTSDVKVHVSYGRRYLVETPDQIWQKYLETLEKGADDSSKDLQLEQYYEAEFQSDDIMRAYYLKLIKVEPLVHYTIPAVLDMEIGQEAKEMKAAFPSWKHVTMMDEVISKTVEQLIESLKQYTNEIRTVED